MDLAKTITSLAILKVNWETKKIDYVEIFVPFIVHLIFKNEYKTVEVKKIKEDFEKEYGLTLPYHPLVTILERVRVRGFIQRQEQLLFVPVKEKIIEKDFSRISEDQERKINKIIGEFIIFCREKFKKNFEKNEAEKIFLDFLKDTDYKMIFSASDETIFPEVNVSKIGKYLIGKYIYNARIDQPEVFRYIVDVAIGQILAQTILYKEYSSYKCNLKGINYYLDVGIVFALMGMSGEEKRDAQEELVKTLQDAGANIYVFEHTLQEYIANLQYCLYWIDKPEIDFVRAKKTLRYLINNEYTASDVELEIVQSSKKIEKYNIKIIKKPGYENYKYQIDEVALKQAIIYTYKRYNNYFVAEEKEETIKKDIDSISAIIRLREGARPRSLKMASHVLITTNPALAKACNLFENKNDGSEGYHIPSCLNDIFIGTLVWLLTPAKTKILNEKRIIADSYAAIQPDEALISKYFAEIHKLKSNNHIKEEDYYLLRQSRVAFSILQEKTLGDSDNFSSQTAQEILDELKDKYKIEGEKKYKEEKERHIKTESILGDLKKDFEDIKNQKIAQERNTVEFCKKASICLGWLIFIIALIIEIILVIKIVRLRFSGAPRISYEIIAGAMLLLGSCFGFNLLKFKFYTVEKINSLLSSMLIKK